MNDMLQINYIPGDPLLPNIQYLRAIYYTFWEHNLYKPFNIIHELAMSLPFYESSTGDWSLTKIDEKAIKYKLINQKETIEFNSRSFEDYMDARSMMYSVFKTNHSLDYNSLDLREKRIIARWMLVPHEDITSVFSNAQMIHYAKEHHKLMLEARDSRRMKFQSLSSLYTTISEESGVHMVIETNKHVFLNASVQIFYTGCF
jgi:hypothetical protein